MRLIGFELKKIWQNKVFLLCFACIVVINAFLIWQDASSSNNLPSDAYKTVASEMKDLTNAEKGERIAAALETTSSLLKIKQYISNPDVLSTDNFTEIHDLLLQFGEDYKKGNYFVYTDSLENDYRFLSAMQAEVKAAINYHSFLENIQSKAETLSSVSIFSNPDSYDNLSIQQAAKSYSHLANIQVDFYPQKGYRTAISFLYTDLLLIFSMLLMSSLIVREEKDNGLLAIIFTTPNGRLKTAFAKLITLWFSMFLVLFFLYGTNLLVSEQLYGLGSLSRSVQSVQYLSRCVLPISTGFYLVVFLLTKWLVAALVGSAIMIVSLRFRQMVSGWTVSLFFLGAQLLVYSIIPATSNLNILKYANMVGILNVNDFIGSYQSLYCFGKPISIILVELITSTALLVIVIPAFLVFFAFSPPYYPQGSAIIRVTRKAKATTVFRQEIYKSFVLHGVLPILIVFLCTQVYQGTSTEFFLPTEEIYYRYYMENLEGKYNQKSYDWLQSEYESFAPLRDLQYKLDIGLITNEDYSMRMNQHYSLQTRQVTYQRVISEKFGYIKANEDAQIVYDTGYKYLFDFDDKLDLVDSLVAGLLGSVVFSSILAYEHQSGMSGIIKTMPLGRRFLLRKKYILAWILSIFLAISILLPRIIAMINNYGLPGLFVPAKSIAEFSDVPKGIHIFGMILFCIALRVICFFYMANISFVLSENIKGIMGTIVTSALIFCIFPLLANTGLPQVKWLSFYTLFHLSALIPDTVMTTFGVIFLCFLLLTLLSSYLWLTSVYDEN